MVRPRKQPAAPSPLGLTLANAPRAFDAIAKARATRSFIAFVELFWPVIEPKQPFVRGWVQEEIAYHLEAVHRGEIDKILINVPPGFSKSTLVNVFFAAWEWGPMQRPDLRYISWSYAHGLTKRDNGLCRKIIESALYQRLWGQCEACVKRAEGAVRCEACERDRRFRLDGDQNARAMYRNDWGGFRFASSVLGGGTGHRADRLIFDDPHSVKTAESDAQRMATVDWFAGTLPTRVRNTDGSTVDVRLPEWVRRAHQMEEDTSGDRPLKSATIGIMQRVHLQDVSGVILATPELGYVHLLIEMEYEGDTHPARVANDNEEDPKLRAARSIPWRKAHPDPRRAHLASVPRPIEADDTDATRYALEAGEWEAVADAGATDDDAPTARGITRGAWWATFANIWTRISVSIISLADPVRYPRHAVETTKWQMLLKSGANAVAAQFQQWPQEAGGLYFPKATAKYINAADLLPALCGYETRGWDLASTDDDPMSAATVGVRGYIDEQNRVIIVDVVKLRGGPDAVDATMKETADADGEFVRQDMPKDPGQAGKYQINAMTKLLIGHAIDSSPEGKAGKVGRAYPLSSQWKAGNVYLVRAHWNAEYLRIVSGFPVERFKDEVDATVRMFDSQVRADVIHTPVAPMILRMAK